MAIDQLQGEIGDMLTEHGKTFPKSEIPRFPDGALDVARYNDHPKVIELKLKMIGVSNKIHGKNVIDSQWLKDNGFSIASVVLIFDGHFGVCHDCGAPLDSSGMCTAPLSRAD